MKKEDEIKPLYELITILVKMTMELKDENFELKRKLIVVEEAITDIRDSLKKAH